MLPDSLKNVRECIHSPAFVNRVAPKKHSICNQQSNCCASLAEMPKMRL